MSLGDFCFRRSPSRVAAAFVDSSLLMVVLLPLSEPDKRLSHIRLLGWSFKEPPLYEMGSGLCESSFSASPPTPRPGRTGAMCMPDAGSCG